MIYSVKPDLTHKAILTCGGSRIDSRGLSTRVIVVKGVSVRLLDLIADSQNLKFLRGDIGNVFIQTYIKEKLFTKFGPEFGDRAGATSITERAIYG